MLPNLACCQTEREEESCDIDATEERYPVDDGYVAVHETGNKLPTYVEIVAAADKLVDEIASRVTVGTEYLAQTAAEALGEDRMVEVPEPEVTESQKQEFRFFVQKPERHTPLGAILDDADGKYIFIAQLMDEELDHAFPRYNLRAGYGEVLSAGDFIVEVNGISGDSRQMMEEMNVERELTLTVRRSTEVRVQIKKSGTLGLEFHTQRATCLLVQEIHDEGPIHEWNCSNPGQEVKPLDRLVAVNGTAPGDSDLLFGLLWETELSEMTFVRPVLDASQKVIRRPLRSGRPAADAANEWLDQYFAKYLRQRPKIFNRHRISQIRSCVYLIDGYELRLEWTSATRPGGEGYLIGVVGEERMPIVDFFTALKKEGRRSTPVSPTSTARAVMTS
jgi:hypothetical protein